VRPCRPSAMDSLPEKLLELERLAIEGKSAALIELLGEVVPTFHPFPFVGVHQGR
jgi:hypothetical protein